MLPVTSRLRLTGFSGLALIVTILAGCAGGDPAPESTRAPGRIALITVDGWVADESAQRTLLASIAPSGGGFAATGWTTTTMTRPAVASYLTGLSPVEHRVTDDLYAALPDTVPTLAERLQAAGYRTAAFPDSAFLGFTSGLLRGFDIVDEPPPLKIGGRRFLPAVTTTDEQLEHFRTWAAELPADAPAFVWLHMSLPYLSQLAIPEVELPDAAAELERLVSEVVERFATGESTAVVVAGTFAEVRGGEASLAGAGIAFDDASIEVPILGRLPGTAAPQTPRWAPDVAVTLASFAGVELPGAVGADLREPPNVDRILFAETRAPLDQFGWRMQRAARSGHTVRMEGLITATRSLDPALEPDTEVVERLIEALAARPKPTPVAGVAETTLALLQAESISVDPISAVGRQLDPERRRARVAGKVREARGFLEVGNWNEAVRVLLEAYRLDPQNLTVMIDLGQLAMETPGQEANGRELIERAVALYPENADSVHAYIHAIWEEDRQAAEGLLQAILPARPQDADLLYDLACLRSLAGDDAQSEEYLRSAIDAGFRDWPHMEADADLRTLRESGRFAGVMKDYRQ